MWSDERREVVAVGGYFQGPDSIEFQVEDEQASCVVRREEEILRLDGFNAREKRRRPNTRDNEHECSNNRNNKYT